MTTPADTFLRALGAGMTPEERLILCGFAGDPDQAPYNAWKPRPWAPDKEIPFGPRANAYVTVAAFGRAQDTGYRRRKDTFRAGLALMVDDVGTKVPPAVVQGVRPSFIIETSPGNFQWWLLLAEPLRDADKFDALIRAFIQGRLLGADPGMSGITRVGRLPGYTNGKPQHKGWITKLTASNPSRRFTVDQLLKTFDLKLQGTRGAPKHIPNDVSKARIAMYINAESFLKRRKMLKRQQADPSGWREMRCPWKDEHTGGADNGAAIREPRAENQFYGAFRCHHGSHIDKGWQELTDWIADLAADEVNTVTRFVRITKKRQS
jgi:hypothetical protein